MRLRYFFILLILACLTGCTAPGTYMTRDNITTYRNTENQLRHTTLIPINANLPKADLTPHEYRIGSYDVLNIFVWDHPELSSPTAQGLGNSSMNLTISQPSAQAQGTGYLVDANGYIYFPYAGNVKIAGLTAEQARILMAKKLSVYIRHPQVSLNIANTQSNSVHLLGALVKPGEVFLPQKPMNLMEAISTSGGIDQTAADASQIYVFRGNLQSFKVFQLNAQSPQDVITAEYFYLRPNDIIYVAPATITNWNKVISEILPSIQTLWYTSSLANNFHYK